MLSQVSCCWTLRQESWGRLRATRDSCGTIPGCVTASEEEVAILSSEWVFRAWGMDGIMCGAYIVQNRFIRYIKGMKACVVACKYLFVWWKQVQAERIKDSSIMSSTRLNQLPEKQWLTGDLHSGECQSHRMRNRISCCSFNIEVSICTYTLKNKDA